MASPVGIKRIIMILMLAAVATVCQRSVFAVEVDEDIWSDRSGRGGRQFEITPEHMEEIIKSLTENNQKLAEKLRKLQKDDPGAFRKEIRDLARKKFSQKPADDRGSQGPGGPRGPQGKESGQRPDAKAKGPVARSGHRSGWSRERMQAEHDEYIEWLKENYANEAEQLAEAKKKGLDTYSRRFWLSKRRYGTIMETEKRNPDLAEVLKEDLELQRSRDAILRQIKSVKGKKLAKLKTLLKGIIERRFDLVVRKKQIRYEDLRSRLEKLRKEVEQQQVEVEKLKQRKAEETTKRINELIEKTEKITWE